MSSPFPCPNPPSPCETNPNPVTGYSAEAPDSTTFIGLAWNGNPPPLNKPFNLVPCEAIAESQVSQVDADRIAQNAAVVCSSPCTEGFPNTAQTATGECADGSSYSLTIPAGQYVAENQVLADRLAFTAAVQALKGRSICLGALVPTTACRNEFYFGQISAVTTDGPLSMEMSGDLPDGLSIRFESDRAVIEGTPTSFGSAIFTITATSATGVVTRKNYQISVSGIVTGGTLPDAFGGTPYSQALVAFNADNLTPTWSLISGQLPPGLSLDSSTGVISGTATQSGFFTFTVAADFGNMSCQSTFTIHANLVNWGNMVWSNVTVRQAAGGVAQGIFSGASLFSQTAGGPGDFSLVNALGTVTYAGPVANCKITVITTAGPGSVMGFEIKQDGVQKLLVDNTQIGTPGTYVFNFTIAATAGSTITITGHAGVPAPGNAFTYCADTVPLAAFSAVLANA